MEKFLNARNARSRMCIKTNLNEGFHCQYQVKIGTEILKRLINEDCHSARFLVSDIRMYLWYVSDIHQDFQTLQFNLQSRNFSKTSR